MGTKVLIHALERPRAVFQYFDANQGALVISQRKGWPKFAPSDLAGG
jgi:hypothetical protein